MDKKKKPGYAGSIQNSGAQMVRAPFAANVKRGNGTVRTGEDLRQGARVSGPKKK